LFAILSFADHLCIYSNDFITADRTPPLAVYRIHVLPIARRLGLASALLDVALEDCVYGTSTKALVEMYDGKANTTAFSQPTQAGRYLAETWIRKGSTTEEEEEASRLIVFDEADV
jgi:GNAT superfamily N-acetyltransferase